MKTNLKYYTREVGAYRHWKFRSLRKKYGWEGDGRFWALHDMIAEAQDCILKISTYGERVCISDDLGLSPEEFEQFIAFLCCEECRLLIRLDEGITTQYIQEILADTMKGRSQASERVRNYRNKKSNALQSEINPLLSTDKTRQDKTKEEGTSSPLPSSVAVKKRKQFISPTNDEVRQYFKENSYPIELADKAFNTYADNGWKDTKGNAVKNWKQKMQNVWFKEENKIVDPIKEQSWKFQS